MKTNFRMESEYYDRDTIEKAFYLAGVDRKYYDLFYEEINVSRSDWNFKDAPGEASYHFRENN